MSSARSIILRSSFQLFAITVVNFFVNNIVQYQRFKTAFQCFRTSFTVTGNFYGYSDIN